MKRLSYLVLVLLLVGFQFSSIQAVSGSWETIYVNQEIKPADAYQTVNPFNTVMYVSYYIEQEADRETIETIFTDETVRLHKLFDRNYRYYLDEVNPSLGYVNNLYQLNRLYGTGEAMPVDQDLFDLLKGGIEYTKISKGSFNMLVGAISDFWTEIFDEYNNWPDATEIDPRFNLTNAEEVAKYAACIPDYEDIDQILVLDEENHTIQFNEYISVDLSGKNICSADSKYRPSITVGGIGKGYATEVVVNQLIDAGFTKGAVYSGGSSISSLGESVGGNGHSISFEDPRSTFFDKKVAFSIKVNQKFNVSTSGNYTVGKNYRFIDFEKEEVVYRHHILNPLTGLPSNYHRSVTVYSETVDAGVLDALSTILVNATLEDGIAFQQEMKKAGVSFEVVWIDQVGLDGTYTCDNWCPPNPSTLHVTSTSNFYSSLQVTEGVQLHYVGGATSYFDISNLLGWVIGILASSILLLFLIFTLHRSKNKPTRNYKFSLQYNEKDIVITVISTILVIVLVITSNFMMAQYNGDNLMAVVYVQNEAVTEVALADLGENQEYIIWIYDNENFTAVGDEFIKIEPGILVDEGDPEFGNKMKIVVSQDLGIRVAEETSPRKVCSSQGWVNNPGVPVVCLPNSVYVIIRNPSIDPVSTIG